MLFFFFFSIVCAPYGNRPNYKELVGAAKYATGKHTYALVPINQTSRYGQITNPLTEGKAKKSWVADASHQIPPHFSMSPIAGGAYKEHNFPHLLTKAIHLFFLLSTHQQTIRVNGEELVNTVRKSIRKFTEM